MFAFSFSVQPNLKPLWGSRTTAGEAGVEEEAEGQGMETSDRQGTWGMASQRARPGCIRTRCPITTHPTGKGTHLQRSEWGEWLGSNCKQLDTERNRIIHLFYFTSTKFMNFYDFMWYRTKYINFVVEESATKYGFYIQNMIRYTPLVWKDNCGSHPKAETFIAQLHVEVTDEASALLRKSE